MVNKSYKLFRQHYEVNISKKLEIDKEEYCNDFYEIKQPIGLAIFGFLMFFYGLYISFNLQIFYGLIVIFTSTFFIYGRFKKNKLVFRLSKNGIWTAEFGFIYFRHIARFEFYRYVGKYSSERMKIFIKDYKLYKMDKPFLEQRMSHINDYENLKPLLEKSLTIANK